MTNDTVNTSIAYDAENRVKAIGGDSNYVYDGGALRVKKGTTTYIYSGAKVIAEYSGTTLSKEYIYFGGQLVATWTGSSNPVLTYQYADHLSLRAEADASGNISSATGHLPFGDAWYQFGTASKWKFTSYERDSTGLDYAVFRNNTSRYGRFMQPDKMAGNLFDPQSMNRFAYTRNDPVNRIDPFGMFTICIGLFHFDDTGTRQYLIAKKECFEFDFPRDGNRSDEEVKADLLRRLLNPECAALFPGGLKQALNSLLRTTYLDYAQQPVSVRPKNDTWAAFTASRTTLGPPSQRMAKSVMTYVRAPFYSMTTDQQDVLLVHELKHGVQGGEEIDPVDGDYGPEFSEISIKCKKNDVETETSDVSTQIPLLEPPH